MLKELISQNGPSARENGIADYITEKLKGKAEVSRDAMGNVTAHIKGGGKKLMLAAHMDEIGIIATFIEDNGFVRFAAVGGLSAAALPYKRVKFLNGTSGVIAYPEKTELKDLKIQDMYIDVGAASKEEAEELVSVGDMAGFESDYLETENRIVSGKLDDRIGCFLLLKLAENVKNPVCDLYLSFTVQEEVGLKGAVTAAYSVNPDIAVAVDVTDTGDTPSAETMAVKLDGGAAIKIKDGRMISSPEVVSLLENTAKENGIKYQYEVLGSGTTDASVMQISRCGVPTGAVSVPTRYIHTVSETVSKKDIEEAQQLLQKLVMRDELK